jgi:hypothetical protein
MHLHHCTVDCFAAGSSSGFVAGYVSPFKELVRGGVFSSREEHTRDYLFVIYPADIDSIAGAKMDFRLALVGGGYKPVADTNKGTLSRPVVFVYHLIIVLIRNDDRQKTKFELSL